MIDRRVQKTRHSLHNALISLILEKDYEAITVSDIIDRADVGRATFYAHYSGKDQLLEAGLDTLGKTLITEQKALRKQHGDSRHILAFSRTFFEHALGYKAVYRVMLGNYAGTLVTSRLRKVLRELVEEELYATNPPHVRDDLPQEAVIQFVVGTIMSTLTWWLDTPQQLSAVQVDTVFRQFALPALHYDGASEK